MRYIILALILSLLTSCRPPEGSPTGTVKTGTSVGGSSIYTVEHDKHLFVVMYSGGVLHHPDCRCGKK
jgi:hypothetical protein